ncbi:MAG: protein translocase subunit SecF [Proteobacteria bacterium]|nr:protein translocase subunit SecF [Pseudomonadota bacterium]
MAVRPFIHYLPSEFHLDFIGVRFYPMMFSAIITVVALVSIMTKGFNLGIDFAGGVLLETRSERVVNIEELRNDFQNLNVGEVAITTASPDGRELMIRIQEQEGGDQAQNEALKKVQGALPSDIKVVRTEVVGPKVGAELMIDGALAVALALIGIAIYVWLRFEWQFALAALLSLTHDVVAVLGLFSIFQLEFNLTVIAAVLAIAGYSVNDTVVVFDRIRELLRKYRKMPIADLLNLASNQVFARTLLTTASTFVATLALLIAGGDVLRPFSIAMTFGVVIGVYSTIYVAKPILIYTDLRREDVPGSGNAPVPEYERAPKPAE